MIQKFKNLADAFRRKISPTVSDTKVFYNNIHNEFICTFLDDRISFMEQREACIGKPVYRYKNSFRVTLKEGYVPSVLNPIEEDSFIYSSVDFDAFMVLYLDYQIEYLTKELTTKSPFLNSTNKLVNLKHEIEIDATIFLLGVLKNITDK